MDWEPEVWELYNKIIERVPEQFKPVVSPLLQTTAERQCIDRNGGFINEADLVIALFDITPEPFQAESIENLNEFGIDVERYQELKNIRDKYMKTWEKVDKPWYPGNYWFTMYLTDRCNQKCLHCAADEKTHRDELSTEQWIQIIDNLETSLRNRGRRGVYIWFGGEALCRKDLKDIIKYCGDKGYLQSISTNGILFDDDMAKFCKENGMYHVFISLDSADPEKTDKIRGVPGAFKQSEKAIKAAVNNGLMVLVTATVMKQNVNELEEIKSLIESWGAIPYYRAVIKQRKAAENWAEIGLNQEEYKKFYDFKYKYIVDVIREGKGETLPVFYIYDMTPFMEKPLNDIEMTYMGWGVGCQACRTISGIDINGDVFPCDYPSTLKIGNVLNQTFEEVMESQIFKDIRDRKRTGKCGECHHIDLCGGGCRVHAETETGDFFAPFSYCWHEPHD